jgi:hypothetical protein
MGNTTRFKRSLDPRGEGDVSLTVSAFLFPKPFQASCNLRAPTGGIALNQTSHPLRKFYFFCAVRVKIARFESSIANGF